MQVAIETTETVSINRRDGTSVEVNVSKLHANALPYLFLYGVKQAIADSASSAENADEAQEMMDAKLAALYSGDIRVSTERTGDPVLREALALVTPKIRAKAKAEGYKVSGKGDDVLSAKALREMAVKFLGDRNSATGGAAKAWELARKRVEESAFDIG